MIDSYFSFSRNLLTAHVSREGNFLFPLPHFFFIFCFLAVRGDLRAVLALLLGADQLPGVLPRRGPQERGLQGVPGLVRDAEGN